MEKYKPTRHKRALRAFKAEEVERANTVMITGPVLSGGGTGALWTVLARIYDTEIEQ